jgi:hypothetical protein
MGKSARLWEDCGERPLMFLFKVVTTEIQLDKNVEGLLLNGVRLTTRGRCDLAWD